MSFCIVSDPQTVNWSSGHVKKLDRPLARKEVRQEHHCNHHVLVIATGKAETGNHDLQEKLEKYVILLTKVVSDVFFIFNGTFIFKLMIEL